MGCSNLGATMMQVCVLDTLRYVLSDAQLPHAHAAVLALGGGYVIITSIPQTPQRHTSRHRHTPDTSGAMPMHTVPHGATH